ncbi:hypothetical protein K461DRAFT_133089 [Myriangium duriaei CBS 260.36]|uniref:Uncharacterized protein n=1 Tax=Myriangium duriaei CBS 260.36 TaxID=1168546 RepID=A0A9P4J025_9PEZI|nr:hypothetical protein K461DRAFT_133089 [Myriangium duriaei CBS 260.36]
MSEAPRKRSRFDKTESEVKRSRFDQPDPRRRRSRSPGSRDHGSSRRSRSPASRGNDISATASPEPGKANALSSAAEKAKAAAARINAEMQAKKAAGLLPTTQTPKLTSVKSDSAEAGDKKSKDNDIYEQDGDFIKDIEVNDLRNRYTLTKGAFQKEVNTRLS